MIGLLPSSPGAFTFIILDHDLYSELSWAVDPNKYFNYMLGMHFQVLHFTLKLTGNI